MNKDIKAYRGQILHFLAKPSDEKSYQFFQDGLLVVKDGLVAELGPATELLNKLPSDITINHFPNALIMPGFIDAHVHYPQIDIIASYGNALLDWLDKYVYPAEMRYANENHAKASAELFCQQLLRNGTTAAMVFATSHTQSVNAIFNAALKHNMRLISGKVLKDRNAPSSLLDTPQSVAEISRQLITKWHKRQRLQYALMPRFVPTCSDELLNVTQQLLQEDSSLYFHTHFAETQDEIAWVKQLYPDNSTYLDIFVNKGLLNSRSVFAHAIYCSQQDYQCFAQHDAALALCPSSNLFLGSGLSPFNAKLEASQVKYGVGSDIGAGTSFSLLQNLKEAYYCARLQDTSLTPLDAFYLATLGGATALNLQRYIGNFVEGKEADFVVLNLEATTLLKHRIQYANKLEEKLFALMILGDDRVVQQTYVYGKCCYKQDF